jgi:hypothetical protein
VSPISSFRIIHAATYHGETSVLRLALYEIFHHVDVIVLVDSNTTFTGMHSSVERIADLLPGMFAKWMDIQTLKYVGGLNLSL